MFLLWSGLWREKGKIHLILKLLEFGKGHRRFKSEIFIAFNLQVLIICILRTCKHHHVLEIGLDLVATSEIQEK